MRNYGSKFSFLMRSLCLNAWNIWATDLLHLSLGLSRKYCDAPALSFLTSLTVNSSQCCGVHLAPPHFADGRCSQRKCRETIPGIHSAHSSQQCGGRWVSNQPGLVLRGVCVCCSHLVHTFSLPLNSLKVFCTFCLVCVYFVFVVLFFSFFKSLRSCWHFIHKFPCWGPSEKPTGQDGFLGW